MNQLNEKIQLLENIQRSKHNLLKRTYREAVDLLLDDQWLTTENVQLTRKVINILFNNPHIVQNGDNWGVVHYDQSKEKVYVYTLNGIRLTDDAKEVIDAADWSPEDWKPKQEIRGFQENAEQEHPFIYAVAVALWRDGGGQGDANLPIPIDRATLVEALKKIIIEHVPAPVPEQPEEPEQLEQQQEQ